ncbi:MAG: MBL fold metallo-hydrolase, partial [Flavobacteriales bacterium CG_4_10_14_0_8_um_filter_32_5]
GKDNELFSIGKITLKLLHTPGHTMESTTYLLIDEEGKEQAIFTGDTLFIGDVGRPDLAVKSDVTEADLAAYLFDSLRNKIMVLPDIITIYPAHGAGSACGKNMSKETFDTLGHQKEVNYALRADMTKEEFIKEVTTGLMPPPQYFPKNVAMNKGVNKTFDEILKQGLTPLSAQDVNTLIQDRNILCLDVRSTTDFVKEHLPNSLFI